MPSDGITYFIFLLPGIFCAISLARPGYFKNSGLPYILPSLFQGGSGTEPEPETGTGNRNRRNRFFPKPKAEPEPPEPFSRNRNRNQNLRSLLNCTETQKPRFAEEPPEPKTGRLEPFHAQTVTEPNRGLPVI